MMSFKKLFAVLALTLFIPTSSFATNLIKTEIDRSNGNCKTVSFVSEWDDSEACLEEKAVLITADAELAYSQQDDLNLEEGNDTDYPGRWGKDPKDGEVKVNWIYTCTSKSVDAVKAEVTLCQ